MSSYLATLAPSSISIQVQLISLTQNSASVWFNPENNEMLVLVYSPIYLLNNNTFKYLYQFLHGSWRKLVVNFAQMYTVNKGQFSCLLYDYCAGKIFRRALAVSSTFLVESTFRQPDYSLAGDTI